MKKSLQTLLLAFAATLGAGQGARAQAQETADRPNIVFIFADDWGYGDLSCHGSETYLTPNLDKLASEGTDYTQFTVNSPVCSPSRVAVMTGLYPSRLGAHHIFSSVHVNAKKGLADWLDPTAVQLPRLLQKAGYATAHFGKWHLTNRGVPDAPLPIAYGYDSSAVFNGPGPQSNRNPNLDLPLPSDHAMAFIRQNAKRPFFINLWIHAAHTPHYPKAEWMERFKHLPKQQQIYASVLADADARIGSLLKTLDELGIADRTLVVFSSDNGPEETGGIKKLTAGNGGPGFGTRYSVGTTDGRRGRKRSLYMGGVGVPFIVRWPGHTPAGKVDGTSVITAVDLLPTFCAVAGVDLPEGYEPDGENVLPALLGKPTTRSKPIFWDWRVPDKGINWPQLGVREGDWNLLMTTDQKRLELYRVSDDVRQREERSKQHPELVLRLSKMALDWKKTLPTEPPQHCLSKLRQNK